MANKKSSSRKKSNQNKHIKEQVNNSVLYGVICIVVSLLLMLFFFVDSSAPISRFFKQNLLGFFGVPAVLVPFVVLGIGIYLLKDKNSIKAARKSFFIFLILSVISAFVHLSSGDVIRFTSAFDSAYALTLSSSHGGGLFGAMLAVPLYELLHKAAAYIILSFILLILISLVTEYSVVSLIIGICKGLYSCFVDSGREIDNEKSYQKGKEISENMVKHVRKKNQSMSTSEVLAELEAVKEIGSSSQMSFEDIDIPIGNEKAEQKDIIKSIKEKNKKIKDNIKNAVFAGVKNNDEIMEQPDKNGDISDIDDVFSKMLRNDEVSNIEYKSDNEQSEDEVKREKNLTEGEKLEISNEIDNANSIPVKQYVYPSTDILNRPKGEPTDTRREMYNTANRLIETLESFGVKAKLLQVTPGPSVTRYEILPNTGVKLSKIVGLADDLALNLAVMTVLVAPVPGKAAVGIEIPNKETSSVTARELLESEEFTKSKSKLTIALGKDIGGRVVVGDIAKMPHLLIAGATGSGKSVCINTIITSLLYKASPEEVKLIMVDPKVVELGMYNGIPHLLIPVVTDPKKAAGALNWAVTEMMHRYDTFAENFVKNLEGYNQLMEKTGGIKLPQIVIIIDELADLMMVAAKEVEDYICRLAQLARAAGIHLIVATQRPTVDVITGLIKANIPSRIAFAVASQVDSRTIIDKAGAEKLLGRGDMLYSPQGARSPLRVQGAFVSDDEIERLMDFMKAESDDNHYSEDLAEHIERVAIGDNGVTPDEEDDGDELLPQAIELAVELGQISTAMIQRRLKVGYSRAGRIIDQMEARGIISGANGSKPRQVYINHADLQTME